METNLINFGESRQTMSSLEIAKLTGKDHAHIMRDIRNMEPAWEKISQSKFGLASYTDAQGKSRPCYELIKRECLYVATKFNDEARARLVIRWEELEKANIGTSKSMTAVQMFALQAQINLENENRLNVLEKKVENMEAEREENGRLLLEAQVSTNVVPTMTLRKNIIALVNEYSAATNTPQKDVWHSVYKDLYYKYDKSINSYTKLFSRESKLDVAERKGLLQPIFDIISDMILRWRESQK